MRDFAIVLFLVLQFFLYNLFLLLLSGFDFLLLYMEWHFLWLLRMIQEFLQNGVCLNLIYGIRSCVFLSFCFVDGIISYFAKKCKKKRTHQRPPWYLLFNFRTTLPHQGSAPATSSSRLPAWAGSSTSLRQSWKRRCSRRQSQGLLRRSRSVQEC